MTFVNFGEAIEALKQGKQVAKKDWSEGIRLVIKEYPNHGSNSQVEPYGKYICMTNKFNDFFPWEAISTYDLLSEDWIIFL